MFDFDAGKLILIGIVALIVIGPKDLPRVLRELGRAVAKMRRMASEFQGQFMEAVREADMADIKDEVAKLSESAHSTCAFNPVADIRNEMISRGRGPSPAAALSAPAGALHRRGSAWRRAYRAGPSPAPLRRVKQPSQKPDHAPDKE